MKRSPLKRKAHLRPKGAVKPKREPWILPKKTVDLSRMDCCPEAKARAEFLISLPCIACGERGTRKVKANLPRADDMVIHHLRHGTGMGGRAVWWRTLGLHERCHADTYPVSVHGRRSDEFRRLYGTEEELLVRANARIPLEFCRPAPGQE